MAKICYVDFGVVPVGGSEYVSEFTWVVESGLELTPHHYFVDYPGAKELERQIIEVVGGAPFIRYSCATVLKTFLTDIPNIRIVAFKYEQQKQLFSALLMSLGIATPHLTCTFDDLLEASNSPNHMLSVISLIEDKLKETKNAAARVFGNSL